MDTGSFNKLVVLNAALLLIYVGADVLMWATVSTISFVTHVSWSPMNLQVDIRFPSGANGSMVTNDAALMCFVFITIVNLVLAYVGTRYYPFTGMLLLGYFALSSYVQYLPLVNFISGFQQTSIAWNCLYIAVGGSMAIIPNLPLLVAVVATTVNIVFVRRKANLPSKMQEEKMEERSVLG